MIECRVCKQLCEPHPNQGRVCGPCYKEYQRKYRARNSEKLRLYFKERDARNRLSPEWVEKERKRGRDYWQSLRHDAIMAYGGYSCACCGETEPRFLSIDHVNNDGAEHRRSLGYDGNGKGASSRTLAWLKENGYPSGFQVLCMNCNFGKATNKGICPHEAKAQRKPREFGERLSEIIPSQAHYGKV